MGVLQEEFERLLGSDVENEMFIAELIKKKFSERGIILSEEENMTLRKAVKESQTTQSIDIPIERLEHELDTVIDLNEITEEELEEVFEDYAGEKTINIIKEVSPIVLSGLHKGRKRQLQYCRKLQAKFESRLKKRWGHGLDRLEMLIEIAHESGAIHYQEVSSELSDHELLLLEVLIRLQARACRISREILCLLKSGYSDGAYARWRSLHEVAAIATFISNHKGDIAQRYIDHIAIRQKKAAKEYQTYCEELGEEPLSDEDVLELQAQVEALKQKYGANFEHEFGWASAALGSQKPTFRDIEKSIEMAHWRPYFGMACKSIHAGADSLFFSLGMLNQDSEIIALAGASNAGITEPGHHAAVSLSIATTALLTTFPNLDSLVSCHCMFLLSEEIEESLRRAHEQLIKDELAE